MRNSRHWRSRAGRMPIANCWRATVTLCFAWCERQSAIRTRRSTSPRKPSSPHFCALGRTIAGDRLLAWLKQIALNKCRDWARRRKVRAFFTRAVPLEDGFRCFRRCCSRRCASGRPGRTGARDRCHIPIATRLREALVLRTIDGLSQAEAAEVLGVSEKTVETRLYRARAKLKAMLGDQI